MKRTIRASVVGVAIVAAFSAGAWTARVEGRERHPVLRQSIRQLEAIKDRLHAAPTDFGGHKAAALESITHAMGELREAIAFDSK